MKPILSIVIPTYGSPGSTEETVKRLLSFDKPDIEILVSDNDPTGEQIGDRFKDISDDRFSFYRNETNIGRGNNIVRAIERAKADFAMLCSCDDVICQDGVDKVIGQIKKTPDAGIIMGHVMTTENNRAFRPVEPGEYKKGFYALNAIPFLGNLMPIVLRKNCLPFSELYDVDETYMQHRLLLLAAGRGDFVYINSVLGIVQDNGTMNESKKDGEHQKYKIDMSSWDIGESYYSPQSRAKQLISDLEIIDSYRLRQDKKLLLIDKHVGYKVSDVIEYVYSCRDPYMLYAASHVGFLSSDEALSVFEGLMTSYFSRKEREQQYYYRGRLHDKIQNELLLVREGEMIFQRIKDEKKVLLYDIGEKSERLRKILKLIDIDAEYINSEDKTIDKDGIVLIPDVYDEDIENNVREMGYRKIVFMDLMDKYLATAWCNENRGEDALNTFRRIL